MNKRSTITLSKSKLLAYRQCPKRLWLELHRKELRQDSTATQASFDTGNQVGDIARTLYDPSGKGVLIDPQAEGIDAALNHSQHLLARNHPIFEAGFRAEGALAFADVMLPTKRAGQRGWRMVEVKSSTEVKDYHLDDTAIQAWVARSAGVPLVAISVAHIDSGWTYPGNEDYQGLLLEADVSQQAFSRSDEVQGWIADAQVIAGKRREPPATTGVHCRDPYECGFLAYCKSQAPQTEHPVEWLPRISKALKTQITAEGWVEMQDVPDTLLNVQQRRVKSVTLSGKPYFDMTASAAALAGHSLPAYFMDFETIHFAVPIWKGTRPYQQIPFQFSVQRLSRNGKLESRPFLDLSGSDPSRAFAEALVSACGDRGAIFVYNKGFESARISELAQRFPRMGLALRALNERLVDLLPIARDFCYHPGQHGSWSIKDVLPAMCPELSYSDLDGVQNGGMAMNAYLEAISPHTSLPRKAEIEKQLLTYCGLDTYAMVKLWSVFSGNAIKV